MELDRLLMLELREVAKGGRNARLKGRRYARCNRGGAGTTASEIRRAPHCSGRRWGDAAGELATAHKGPVL
jgi:hypothetical protein